MAETKHTPGPWKEETYVCNRCFHEFPLDTMTNVIVYGEKGKYCKKCVKESR